MLFREYFHENNNEQDSHKGLLVELHPSKSKIQSFRTIIHFQKIYISTKKGKFRKDEKKKKVIIITQIKNNKLLNMGDNKL